MKKQTAPALTLTPAQTNLINAFNKEWYNADRKSEIMVGELAAALNQTEVETLVTVMELVSLGVLVHFKGEVFITVQYSSLIGKAI